MPVVALVADVHADVMQQRGIFQPFTLAVGEAVDDARLVEQGDGEPGHLLRVLRPVVAPLGELEHTPSPHVGIPVGLRDLLPVASDVVEDEALAQRQVAERDVRRAEPAKNRVQQDRCPRRPGRRASVRGRAPAAVPEYHEPRAASVSDGAASREIRRLRSVVEDEPRSASATAPRL